MSAMSQCSRREKVGAVPAALLWLSVIVLAFHTALAPACLGSFQVLGNIGISPITASQSTDGRIFFMDRLDLRNSKLRMPNGSFAHAVEYNIADNSWKPTLTVTNTWCSAGAYLSDGSIINTAGNDAGLNAVRIFRPCGIQGRLLAEGANPPCNTWYEDASKLALNSKRWYPTMCTLSDGNFILVGGSTGSTSPSMIVPSYEIVNPYSARVGPQFEMPFLRRALPNYLYPFVHLLPCDVLFIFANTAGIIFDYKRNRVLYDLPKVPGGISRSYPATASSILMPLSHRNKYRAAQVLICGGNTLDAVSITMATDTCWLCDVGRRNVIARRAIWKGPYKLARPRCMPDMLYLMDGSILVINGVQKGIGGFQMATESNLWPEILRQDKAQGITVQANLCGTNITRGYHSSANLIPDGRVIIAGSNAWNRYTTIPENPFSTEYRLEMWTPPYVTQVALPRPKIAKAPGAVGYAQSFQVTVTFPYPPTQLPTARKMRVALIANAFTTHSLSMNLRYVVCPIGVAAGARGEYIISVGSPPTSAIAPPGPYMLAVTFKGIPAPATWILVA